MLRIVFALLLFATPAAADTAVLFSSFGKVAAGPAPVNVTLSSFADSDNNLTMMALANDPAGVKSITIYGNGRALATCPKPTCVFVWARTSMKSTNSIQVQYTNNSGVTRSAIGQIAIPPI